MDTVKFVDKYVFRALAVLGLIAFGVAVYFFVKSLPPRKFTILTGREGGGYYRTAERYKEIAAQKGFDLEIRPTAGSVETLDLLEKGEAGIGFVQGGIGLDADQSVLASMASVYYEPVWILLNNESFDDPMPKRLTALVGKKIGIGEDGSGTQKLALQLLNASGVTGANATLITGTSTDQAEQLLNGELDALFLVTAIDSDVGQRLLGQPGFTTLDVEQAEAYTKKFPFLRVLDIPQGSLDIVADLPAEDKRILATTANLVVRKDFHPDLLRLITIAAVDTHWRGDSFFAARNEFPNTDYSDLPVDRREKAYLERIKNGESTMDNYLPFSFAAIADRYLLFVLPILFLFIPIVSRAPMIYVLWNRFKINRWYKLASRVERRMPYMDADQLQQEIVRVREYDDELLDLVNVPTGQLSNAYQLHEHFELLLRKMQRRADELAAASAAAPAQS